jgi:hypothetical protein
MSQRPPISIDVIHAALAHKQKEIDLLWMLHLRGMWAHLWDYSTSPSLRFRARGGQKSLSRAGAPVSSCGGSKPFL